MDILDVFVQFTHVEFFRYILYNIPISHLFGQYIIIVPSVEIWSAVIHHRMNPLRSYAPVWR